MLDPSRPGSGLLIALVAAAVLAFGTAPTDRADHARDAESGAITSHGVQATDDLAPLIDYLNAVGAATAAAEPAEPSVSLLLAGSTAASGPHEVVREARSEH